MSGRNPEPGTAWLAEIRGARSAARTLASPAADFTGLLSPREELLGLLADSPDDLPLVAFSPFAGLPGGTLQAPARRTEGQARPAGRAPGVRAERASGSLQPASKPSSKPSSTSSPDSRPVSEAQDQPVFSLRPRGGEAPREEGRRSIKIQERVLPRDGAISSAPVSRSAVRTVLAAGSLEEKEGPEDPDAPASRARSERESGALSSPPEPRDTVPVSAMELLDRLADRALAAAVQERKGAATAGEPPVRRSGGSLAHEAEQGSVESVSGLQPAAPSDSSSGAPEILSSGPARRPEPEWPAARVEAPGSVPALEALAAEPSILDAETLADLVNEALVEQARRHGVDLS
jgi:hypothetical protein